ncbi:hypothetical protein, partial [Oricola indica]|uniref:hypothetical protein n=1 Tax=Oricola indica TaxID=2872591 RepID=UPI001CBCDE74
MTVEQEVANLTSAVNSLTDTVNVKKAALDQAVTDAEGHKDQAGVHNVAAEAAETGAVAAKTGADQAYLDTLTALGNVENYDETLGLLNGGAKEIAAAADVVDVFVYDTRKDSDGGAWRKRCQHTSWYNETLDTATRGSRRDFPQVALIVARAATVTIYDLDDPVNCPMWMVVMGGAADGRLLNASAAITSIKVRQGVLVVATDGGGVFKADFVKDNGYRHYSSSSFTGVYLGSIADRNIAGTGFSYGNTAGVIVDNNVNNVAMTVLPGTPVDPVRGMPVPTIAVATDGGVSVIHWDGRVTDSLSATGRDGIGFSGNDDLWYFSGIFAGAVWSTSSQIASDGFGNNVFGAASIPALMDNNAKVVEVTGPLIARGSGFGLDLVAKQPVDDQSAVAYVTDTYNTGFMVGDIKLALAESSADVTDLTDTEAVTNSDMTASDGSDHTLDSGTATYDATDDEIDLDNSSGVAVNSVAQTINVTPGVWAVTVRVNKYTSGAVKIVGSPGTATILDSGVGIPATSAETVTRYITFSASGTHTIIAQTTDGTVASINLFSAKKLVTDRSAAANHPVIHGTVEREAVATGAELAAYSGFSAANYLEVPYSSDFDFGTGDFCLGARVKITNSTTNARIIAREYYTGGAFNGARILLFRDSSNRLVFYVSDGTRVQTHSDPERDESGKRDSGQEVAGE